MLEAGGVAGLDDDAAFGEFEVFCEEIDEGEVGFAIFGGGAEFYF